MSYEYVLAICSHLIQHNPTNAYDLFIDMRSPYDMSPAIVDTDTIERLCRLVPV